MSNAKKYLIGGIVVVVIALYIIFANSQGGTSTNAPMDNATGGATSTAAVPTPTPDSSAQTGQYKDGTYTGPVTNAFYGNIQVVATIQDGVITSVSVPVYPNAPGHTTDVTNMAIPALKTEAIAAQGANVQIVSGATQDSQAFQQSLAAALAQAKS